MTSDCLVLSLPIRRQSQSFVRKTSQLKIQCFKRKLKRLNKRQIKKFSRRYGFSYTPSIEILRNKSIEKIPAGFLEVRKN